MGGRIRRALQVCPVEKLTLNPDCGFGWSHGTCATRSSGGWRPAPPSSGRSWAPASASAGTTTRQDGGGRPHRRRQSRTAAGAARPPGGLMGPTGTMRAVFYKGARTFTPGKIADSCRRPRRGPPPRAARVGICGTDLHIFQGHLDNRIPTTGSSVTRPSPRSERRPAAPWQRATASWWSPLVLRNVPRVSHRRQLHLLQPEGPGRRPPRAGCRTPGRCRSTPRTFRLLADVIGAAMRHARHVPQKRTGSTTTRSPAFTPLPAGASTTSAKVSWPMIPPCGTRLSRWPWKMWRSVPQMPTRSTRRSASPGPAAGIDILPGVKVRAPR